VFARITGAAMRGILVALLVATPSLLLPGFTTDATEMIALLAILAGGLTFAEYNTDYPSFIEFRDAPPVNRLRFIALFLIFFLLTVIAKHAYEPTHLTGLIAGFGGLIGYLTDFPYSPVRLMILVLPDGSTPFTIDSMRIAAGMAYVIASLTVLSFLFIVRVLNWPTGNGAFNVWINLPLFDPTKGGDVVMRLKRDGRVNMIVGFLLPFIIPALLKLASDFLNQIPLQDPQTRIWVVAAWAFLPTSMIMRGIAMTRIAQLIEEKRRRVYANSEAAQTA